MFFNKGVLFYFLTFCFALVSSKSWSQTPPDLTASGNSYYCPLSEQNIVTNFTINNPNNAQITNVYIQISQGYVRYEDILKLTGTHPNISAQPFNSLEGKLVLNWVGTAPSSTAEIITAVKNVVFQMPNIVIVNQS